MPEPLDRDPKWGLRILTQRQISHNEAREAMQRLVNSHFNNPRETHEHARMSIPVNPDRDDDLVLAAYIEQQRRKDGPTDKVEGGSRYTFSDTEEKSEGIDGMLEVGGRIFPRRNR